MKNISVSFEITDHGTFRKVTANAEELGRAVRDVQDEAQNAKREIIKWAEASQAIEVMQNAIGELQGVITDLTSAYQVQLVAETQLNTIMRQRMNATDQEIQSVKDLCSAQQELGVIGDEVQLSGAQQMATFLQNKQSLDVLIPAMNNLIAQQNGLNATNQDAVSIGNMMGKAMQGQVEVLQRVGITFTDAQKQVLQYGNESERAAMLAQVITDNVGNMNAELAKTDAGKWKQTDNYLGDIKEQLGGIMQRFAPVVTYLSQATLAASGIVKLATAFYSAGKAIGLTKAMAEAWNFTSVRVSALVQVCSASMRGAAVSAATLKLAIQGLLVSTGVGVAVWALSEAINRLMIHSDEAANSTQRLSQAEQEAQQAHQQTAQQMASITSELDMNITKLKGFKGNKEQEKKLVQEMNTKYGEALGYYSTVAQWYEALTANSKTYCNQMINEISIRNLANKAANLKQQQHDLIYDEKGNLKKYGTKNRTETRATGQVDAGDGKIIPIKQNVEVKGSSQLDGVNKKLKDLRQQEQNTRKEMQKLVEENNKIDFKKVKGWQPTMPGSGGGKGNGKTTPSPKTEKPDNTPKTHIEELQDQLKKAQEELGNATTIDAKIKADAKVQDIQSEIDEATKGKVTIGAQVDSSYIVQGSDTDKRQSRNNAQQRIDRIKQDYDIGIIADKSDAQRQIDDLNKQLTELGLKPIEVHWETHTEELQRQLQDAQKEFENATTVEAKLKASAKVADLQAQIDTETNGRLTIAAEVEPSYIEQGSLADKRQSYSNAQTKASRIQQDFEIGIIGEDKAKKQIGDLNKQLAKLGKSVKPIKLDINSKDIARIQSLFNIDVTNFDSVRGAMQNIRDITDPTAKGFATAGASCAMLGSAMQQLGADSAAGKAGMVMAAIGQIVLSFAQALRTCKTWVEWLAFGISGTAQMVSLIATVSKFATGGIVGGNQKSGDNVLVRVNSGEMILNAAQQARLFALADGTATYGAASQVATNFAQGAALPSVSVQTDRLQGIMAGDSGKQPKAVEWRVRGRDIVAAVANETRLNRKRSNIRLK